MNFDNINASSLSAKKIRDQISQNKIRSLLRKTKKKLKPIIKGGRRKKRGGRRKKRTRKRRKKRTRKRRKSRQSTRKRKRKG